MANILDAWKQHAMASETMDLTGVQNAHQKKGYNFAQNFPAFTPGTGVGPAQWIGPTLATGYQLGQEGLRSILPESWGGTNIGFVDAIKKGLTEAKLNVEGMGGKGFNEDEYNQWMDTYGYGSEDDGWTINFPDLPTGQNIDRPDIKKLMQNRRFKRQQLMNRRKQDMQQKIRLGEAKEELAAKKPITTFHPSQGNVGPDTPTGGSVTPGSMGMSTVGGGDPFFNKGGRASYFDGGLLSLWPR